MTIAEATPIEIVIAGLGRAGWNIHWKALLAERDDYRVVAAIEPLAERRAEAEAEIGCRTYASLEAYLAAPVGEAVILATPTSGHASEALACLDAGIHVVVDKPMCQTLAEADALIERSRAVDRIVTCYHPLRFAPVFVAIRDLLASERLGRIVEIKASRCHFVRRNDWVMRRGPGSGLHNVWGSHTVDQCLQLAQSAPRDIFCDLQRTVTPGDADDHCKIVMRCEDGVVIDIEVSNCAALTPQPEWHIIGTCGNAVSTGDGLRIRWFDPDAAPPLALQEGAAAGRQYGNDDVLPWQEERLPIDRQTHSQDFYDNLAAAIRDGEALLITPESVRNTIAVLETCRAQNPNVT